MALYLIPVAGLRVEGTWKVGQTSLLNSVDARQFVTDQRTSQSAHFDEMLAPFYLQRDVESFVRVDALEPREAISIATTTIDLLRVYQQSISSYQTMMFGVPGEHRRESITYVAVGDRVATGTIHVGEPLGWTFSDDERRRFESSKPFQFAASFVGTGNLTQAQSRAKSAVQLTSQAILERRPHVQFLNTVMAAESLLLERSKQPQTYRLARRAAYFTCGGPNDLCGRSRPACVLLKTVPVRGPQMRTLLEQRDLGDQDFRERCSEWHRALDRYDVRSEIVHDGSTRVPSADASQVLFWMTHELLPAALTWFADHEQDPLGDLDSEISDLR